MSSSKDSIQTLLKQRRDLRACLQELRSEISALNFKAGKIVTDHRPESEAIPAVVESGTQQQLNEQKPKSFEEIPPNPVMPQPVIEPPILNEEVPGAREVSGDGEEDQVFKTSSEGDAASEVQLSDDSEALLYHAKLLLHHYQEYPAPALLSSLYLENLDAALSKVEHASEPTYQDKNLQDLRTAYRIVAAKSYLETGVNGETLAASHGSILLLWLVPFYIALLTLVFLPLLLLGRSLATRMFVTDFSNETVLVMTAVAAFLWGNVGALSYLAWGIAKRARMGAYHQSSARDVGLRSSLGGVLGLAVYLSLFGWLPVEGITSDMVIGMGAFFAGLTSSILFGFLHTLIGKITSKAEKKKQ